MYDVNLELYMPEQIVSENRKEFQTRPTERKIHPAYKNIERLVNDIFERYILNIKSSITVLTPYSPTEEFSVKDM